MLWPPLDGRKDGTSYLELMEGGISESIQYEIQDIVREEVTPLFRWSKIGTGSGWDNPEQGAVISGGTEIRGENGNGWLFRKHIPYLKVRFAMLLCDRIERTLVYSDGFYYPDTDT